MAYQSDRAVLEAVAFASVACAGGFSAAARAGGLRKATLTQRVRSLEERLGVALFLRSTRTVRLTEEGRAYLDHARRAIAALEAADTAASSFRSAATGTLRVTVPPPLAGVLLDEVVPPYVERCPDVSVVLDSSIGNVDMTRHPFDVALRIGPLADSSLICRRLGAMAGGYYASPKYLSRRGPLEAPADLERHDVISIPRGDRPPSWRFARKGRAQSVVVHPRICIGTFEQGIAAAVAGLGIVPSPRFAVSHLLKKRQLAQVLKTWTPAGYEIYVVAPAVSTALKTRLFVDAVSAWFARQRGRF